MSENKTKKTAKFEAILGKTGNQVLKRRASVIAEAAEAKMKRKVDDIKEHIRDLKIKLMDLEDLSVKNTQALTIAENFNADEWVQDVFDVRMEIRDLTIELEVAEAAYNEYFVDEYSE